MNNTTVILEGGTLLLNQLEFVTPTTVSGTLYGIAFTLFCLYVHALVPRFNDEDRKRQAKFMLVYSAVIMLCGLYNLVSNAWITQDAYIKHANYPGGPYTYALTTMHSPVIIIAFTCQTVAHALTSIIQIWRVWVVWSATRYANLVIVVPSLLFLVFIAFYIRTAVLEAILPLAEVAQLDFRTEIAEVAIQGATTIACTILISLFLLVEQRRQRKLIGEAQGAAGYMKIVAILIESYALESTWLLIRTSLQLTSGVDAFFAETQICVEILAYLLVQYRVASGKSYESQRGQSRMSSLHWNHSTNHATTHHSTNHAMTQFEATGVAGGDPHVSTKLGASDASPVSSTV